MNQEFKLCLITLISGNMWSQSWENIYSHVVPFPNATSYDATPELKKVGDHNY